MVALGLALMVVGAVVAVAEAHYPAHGIAGGAGVVVMGAGAVVALGALGVSLALGVLAGLVLASGGLGLLMLTVREGGRARARRVRTGAEGLVGQLGVVRQWDNGGGSVALNGGLWRARRSPSGDEDEADRQPLAPGDRVVVERLDGLVVSVRRAEEWELM